jgi:hypothetical protein
LPQFKSPKTLTEAQRDDTCKVSPRSGKTQHVGEGNMCPEELQGEGLRLI